MSELKKILASEIEEFRQKGHQYVKDELSMMQFKTSIWWIWSLCSSRWSRVYDSITYSIWNFEFEMI